MLQALPSAGTHQMSAFSLHLKPVSSSGAAYANVPVHTRSEWAACALMLHRGQRPEHEALVVSADDIIRPEESHHRDGVWTAHVRVYLP